MNKQNEVFLPLLYDFCQKTEKYTTKIDISGAFIPNAMEPYFCSKQKIFYIGQDTYWWIDFDKMIDSYLNQKLDKYIDENNSWLNVDRIIEHSNNKEGSFWTLVIRLHLYLKTGKLYDVNEITENEKTLLNDIGWGNLNSIEVKTTLQNEERWVDIDKNIYSDIKEQSRKIDNLKHILNSYNPKMIFIFNWDETKEEDVFKDIAVEWHGEYFQQGVISVYTITNYNTKIIWCPHPNNLRFKSLNINDLILIIGRTLKSLL